MGLPLEIVGQPPKLVGLKCEAFICERFVYKGRVLSNANIVHLCFGGDWHKLILDSGVAIWRRSEGSPKPWSIPNEGFEYPHHDVGDAANVIGEYLKQYDMAATTSGCRVVFSFSNGKIVAINSMHDRSDYQIA